MNRPKQMQGQSSFNTLCRFAEAARYAEVPDAAVMERMAREARLFHFDDAVTSTDTAELSSGDLEQFHNLIHMPFPVIAMSDALGTVVMEAEDKDAVGLFNLRFRFMECMVGGPDPYLHWGQFHVVRPVGGNFQYALAIRGLMHLEGGQYYVHSPANVRQHQESVEQTHRAANFGVFIEQLRLINLPSHMIVEDRPAKVRPPRSRLIPRVHERPRYTLLKPGHIRRRYPGFAGDTHGSPRAHERRRHLRLLSSERYVNKRGQRIVVSGCWVGSTEYSEGRRTYRVLLDR
ncbi:MAG: hypothetical protein ACOCXY_03165 [Planctomycetota bacterium]